MEGVPYCLGCGYPLPDDVKSKEAWRCPSCNSVEYDYGIRPNKKDIVCPDCKGMLDDMPDSKHLLCKKCNIEWRV